MARPRQTDTQSHRLVFRVSESDLARYDRLVRHHGFHTRKQLFEWLFGRAAIVLSGKPERVRTGRKQ